MQAINMINMTNMTELQSFGMQAPSTLSLNAVLKTN
jgi:hypothetical protein